jgi:hypothetical protein
MYRKSKNLYIASCICIENDEIYTMTTWKLGPLTIEGRELETTKSREERIHPNAIKRKHPHGELCASFAGIAGNLSRKV